MNDIQIIYEQPLNELIRVSLRLEHLFSQIDYCQLELNHPQHIRTLIKLIIDLLNLLDRPDLKFKLGQEFIRLIGNLTRLQHIQNISHDTLNETLRKLKQLIEGYLSTRGKIAESLRNNEFLINIRQSLLSAGGDSCIDIPHYFHWINQSLSVQRKQIQIWLTEFENIRHSIELLLNIVRNASEPQQFIAEKGFYSQILDRQAPLQLIQIGLPNSTPLYPEISAGRHRVSLRFMIASIEHRPRQTAEDVPFNLTCCVI